MALVMQEPFPLLRLWPLVFVLNSAAAVTITCVALADTLRLALDASLRRLVVWSQKLHIRQHHPYVLERVLARGHHACRDFLLIMRVTLVLEPLQHTISHPLQLVSLGLLNNLFAEGRLRALCGWQLTN